GHPYERHSVIPLLAALGRARDPLRRQPHARRRRRAFRTAEDAAHRDGADALSARAGERGVGRSTVGRIGRHGGAHMSADAKGIKGRGASWNPQNRFEALEYVRDDEYTGDDGVPRTIYLRDPTRTIITYNDSPDVG